MKLIRNMVVVMFFVLTLSALGAEAAGEVVPLKTDSVIPTWAVQVLGAIAAAMGTWVLWGVGRLINLLFGQKWQEGAKAGALTALEHGIQDAEEEMAASLKEASADGKLTSDEVARLKALALKRAKEVATGPALQMLEQWGADVAGNWISQLIQSKKKAAPTIVVNAAKVESIEAPANTKLSVDETPTAAAGAIASATVTRAPVVKPKEFQPKPSFDEVKHALDVLQRANNS